MWHTVKRCFSWVDDRPGGYLIWTSTIGGAGACPIFVSITGLKQSSVKAEWAWSTGPSNTNATFQGENPQHVYSVRFQARELWGEQAPPQDEVYIDMWDTYLESI